MGAEEEKVQLGPVGKSVARRRSRDEQEYARLLGRQQREPKTERDLERINEERNRLLVLEERQRCESIQPAPLPEGAETLDEMPGWLRRMSETRRAGGAIVDLAAQQLDGQASPMGETHSALDSRSVAA